VRILTVVLLLTVTTGAGTIARAGTIFLSGTLAADQVVSDPTSQSSAIGFATVMIDTVSGLMTTDVSWSGLTGPADRSHVHAGAEGVSGPDLSVDAFQHEVLDDLYRTIPCGGAWATITPCADTTGLLHDELDLPSFLASACDECITNLDDFIATALSSGLYVDVHTEEFPAGEIRGQLLVRSESSTPEPSTWIPTMLFGAFLARRRIGQRIRLATRRNR